MKALAIYFGVIIVAVVSYRVGEVEALNGVTTFFVERTCKGDRLHDRR